MLTTSRLELHPLLLHHLIIGKNSICDLSKALNIPLEQDIFEGIVIRAVHMKIEKMKAAPIETHEWCTYWLIVVKEKKIGIGLLGFKGIPDLTSSVEIGYGINKNYRGIGYMSEAVKALINWAFLHENCTKVTATSVLAQNFASQKVLQKVGFKLDSATTEHLNFSIIKKDFL